jgi:hypothetical protein
MGLYGPVTGMALPFFLLGTMTYFEDGFYHISSLEILREVALV